MMELTIVAVAYVVGSIPFAFLLSLRRGIDLRRVGSGNVGASNVLRVSGTGRAVAALVLDGVKGALVVVVASRFTGGVMPMVVGLASIAGHVFPVWLGFRGGKGVATSAGVFAVLAPSSLGVAAGAFLATVWATRYISVGSLVGAVVLVVAVALSESVELSLVATTAMAVIAYRHRDNVARLRAGTERRIGLRLSASTLRPDGGDRTR
jgi:glycerol-3-phosphate acyltransferase PlsY